MVNSICRVSILLAMFFVGQSIYSQSIDVENIVTGVPFKLTGNVAANSVFYHSNQNSARNPFTYFLQGTLNVGVYQYTMPISYTYSNQGENLEYELPFKFNRLSLHPKYKWVQAHIGDVSMNFSPYTLAGHQFTGGGIELNPKGGISFSAMYGRLLKAVEDTDNPNAVPAFKRMGYGAKLEFKQANYSIGVISFYAKDRISSLAFVPEEKQILPKENLVLSINASAKIIEGLQLRAEYASSAITQDLRAQKSDTGSGLSSMFFDNRMSTDFLKAYKTQLDYSFNKYRLGVAYERIDPGYQTLGAYYFNNDFENITLNGATALFKNKLNISFNIGYQKDDLNHTKQTKTNRQIGSVNITYNLNEKINISGNYSNFSTFTNNKLNQFDIINDDNLLDNQAQQFNYKQLSQNGNLNVNYAIANSKTKRQNLNINYSVAIVENLENNILRIGNGSTFHNINASYTIGLPQKKINISSAINTTYNTIGTQDSFRWGPTVTINKKFLKDKLNVSFGSSYNQNTDKIKSSATNFRLNANYVYQKKHNLSLSAIQLFRSIKNTNTNDLTITFGYNYTFDFFNKKKTNKKN